MEKNTFLMINDMIYDLYSCTSLNEIKAKFLLRLKMVIPYSYASILLHETTEDPDTIRLTTVFVSYTPTTLVLPYFTPIL